MIAATGQMNQITPQTAAANSEESAAEKLSGQSEKLRSFQTEKQHGGKRNAAPQTTHIVRKAKVKVKSASAGVGRTREQDRYANGEDVVPFDDVGTGVLPNF